MHKICEDLSGIIKSIAEEIWKGIRFLLDIVWKYKVLFMYILILIYMPIAKFLISHYIQAIDPENLVSINKWTNSAIIQANSTLLGLLIVGIGLARNTDLREQEQYVLYLAALTVALNIIFSIIGIIQVNEATVRNIMNWILALEISIIIQIFLIFSILFPRVFRTHQP